MTIEEAIYSRLSTWAGLTALVGLRVFPVLAPQDVATPFVVYTRISAERVRSLSGPSGLARPRVQIDVYADEASGGYVAARNTFNQVRLALDGWRQGFADGPVRAATLDTDQDLLDEPSRLYRVTADFFITHEE